MPTEMTALSDSQVPAFLQGESDPTSLSLLTQYAQPPRMKLRQPTARSPLRDVAPEGSVVLMPSMQIVASVEESFLIVPVFFYPEWCVFNPLSMPELPTIRERTLDPKSEIAARSRKPETRTAPLPGYEQDYNNPDPKKVKRISYREHLNFIFELQGGPLAGTQFVATFAKAEHKTGRMLASNIQMRVKSSGVAPYGLVFEAKSKARSNKDGNWYGLDIYLPVGSSPYVDTPAHFNNLKKAHNELFDAYNSNRLGEFISPDDSVEDVQSPAESTEF